jgi:TetR/AcrR family transcriptional repressor of nem operon
MFLNKRLVKYIKFAQKYNNLAKQKVDIDFIINQSIKLFRIKTYHNTSMSDIAEACGLLKGSLYHYFKSKEELMGKVIVAVHEYFKTEVFTFAFKEELNGVDRLQLLFEAAQIVFVNKKTGKMYGNMGVESAMVISDFTPLLQSFFNDFFLALKHIYQTKFEESIAEELAERSVAEIEGSIMLSRIYNNPQYIFNTFERLIDRIR